MLAERRSRCVVSSGTGNTIFHQRCCKYGSIEVFGLRHFEELLVKNQKTELEQSYMDLNNVYCCRLTNVMDGNSREA